MAIENMPTAQEIQDLSYEGLLSAVISSIKCNMKIIDALAEPNEPAVNHFLQRERAWSLAWRLAIVDTFCAVHEGYTADEIHRDGYTTLFKRTSESNNADSLPS